MRFWLGMWHQNLPVSYCMERWKDRILGATGSHLMPRRDHRMILTSKIWNWETERKTGSQAQHLNPGSSQQPSWTLFSYKNQKFSSLPPSVLPSLPSFLFFLTQFGLHFLSFATERILTDTESLWKGCWQEVPEVKRVARMGYRENNRRGRKRTSWAQPAVLMSRTVWLKDRSEGRGGKWLRLMPIQWVADASSLNGWMMSLEFNLWALRSPWIFCAEKWPDEEEMFP